MRRPRHRRSSDAGIALIEALASLVIVAMIALMLATSASTGRRVWEHLDSRETAGEAVDGAQATLRARLEQAFPATIYDQTPPRPDFDGTSSGLVFLSSPPQAARPAPLRRYALAVDTNGALTLSSVSDVGPIERSAMTRETLLSGVRGLEIAYYGLRAPDGERRWDSTWRAQPALPEAVRVRVAFEPGDRRPWPDLIIRPRATIDADCLLNPITHHCKGRA